ncbi:MAG TPA: hypothetical protein VHE13_12455 [Opitutus sp.]|nr:hypothetical protein [Opitutus sp.]
MNSDLRDPSAPAAASCHTACAFAETLAGGYQDWIWCTHPAADVRVRAIGSTCPWSRATPAADGDPID